MLDPRPSFYAKWLKPTLPGLPNLLQQHKKEPLLLIGSTGYYNNTYINTLIYHEKLLVKQLSVLSFNHGMSRLGGLTLLTYNNDFKNLMKHLLTITKHTDT